MKVSPLVLVSTLLALALATTPTALAQATRTWVSGVGDDANPCSRTAPCKTFAGAISKTAAKGEISVLDPGGYGIVTITKSITIDGTGTLAGILSAGTTGVIINAGANDTVTLRNISINGAGTGTFGVRVLAAGDVRLENCSLSGGTTNGIDFQPSNPNAVLHIQNTSIHDFAGAGVYVNAASTKVVIDDSRIEGCGTGVSAAAGTVTLSEVTINDNTGAGLFTSGTGSIKTYRNNRIFGNNPDGSATGSLPLR